MSFDALRLAISTRMIAAWTATDLDRVIHGKNRNGLKAKDDPWVRLTYHLLGTENAELGTGFQRSTGIITIQCFTNFAEGEKGNNALIDDGVLVYQNEEFDGVQCYAANPVDLGRKGETFQENLLINFQFDVFS